MPQEKEYSYERSIPCSGLQTHLKEHAIDIAKNQANRSALIEHSYNASHQSRIEDAKMVSWEEHYMKRRVREVLEIGKWNNTLNRVDGLKLNNLGN
jgi:hypothetical protein